MIRAVLLVTVVCLVAVGGGAASVWQALRVQEGVGAVTIGGWTAFPEMGTPESDPYSKARTARDGVLSLGRAEGLVFTAERDSSGEPLRRECAYTVEGLVPGARFWTIYAADETGRSIETGRRRSAGLQSYPLLRMADGSVAIAVAARPYPGNWLATSGTGRMRLVLTLYDTPVANSTGMTDVELPQILKMGCDA